MNFIKEELEKMDKSALIYGVLRDMFDFKTTPYGLHGTINYKKETLVSLILKFQERNIDTVQYGNALTLTKGEIAKILESKHGIHFTDHEIRYIPKEEFFVLYMTLL